VWQQESNKKFEVTFPKGNTSTDTGSPFVNPLGSGWNTRFPSRDGTPVQTGEASRTPLEILRGKHDFYIQTITVTVNGQDQVCYDKDKTPIQGMKVIIDR